MAHKLRPAAATDKTDSCRQVRPPRAASFKRLLGRRRAITDLELSRSGIETLSNISGSIDELVKSIK